MDVNRFVQFVLQGSSEAEQYAILLVRVSIGLFFAISGANKLFSVGGLTKMYETLVAAKIPFPRQMASFVSGRGEGVSSFVHIHDAAIATVALLAAPPGVYNLVDDDPSPQAVWLPAFARFLGAPAPPRMSEAEMQAIAGEDAVYYATKLSGASNAKAKRILGWKPRRLEWLEA